MKGSTNGGAEYVVRIIDERAREGQFGIGGEVLWELKNVSQPTPTLAWYLPNNFEAEWSGLRFSFRVEGDKKKNLPPWGISSLSVEPLKEGKKIERLERVPLESFLKSAINLSAVECITYPPGYEGAVLNQHGQVVQGWEGWNVSAPTSSQYGEQVAIGWLGETPREVLRDFVVSATDSRKARKLSNRKRLELVARAWKQAPERSKAEAVQRALEAEGEWLSRDRIKQLIREAREAELIPPSKRSKK